MALDMFLKDDPIRSTNSTGEAEDGQGFPLQPGQKLQSRSVNPLMNICHSLSLYQAQQLTNLQGRQTQYIFKKRGIDAG